jgi:predicted secreted hydrolase
LWVIRRLILIFVASLWILACVLTTAILIFRRPTPPEFEQATAAQPVELPCDELGHFEAQTEWWYYTGFLTDELGREYGFELVFFKSYVPDDMVMAGVLPLNWISNPLYFSHFAVSDQAAGEHVFFEQISFPRFWRAGARADRYDVWNGDWRAWGDVSQSDGGWDCYGGDTQHLRASGGRYRLRLELEPARPPALHGEAGVVEMGEAGYSYYYSRPDLEGLGLLYVDGERRVVQADAWMDHQWGSWDVHGGYGGWDWFSLRLDDGSRVMLFGFRDGAGQTMAGSGGTWIAPDGTTAELAAGDFSLEILDRWTSPETGGTYPVAWHLLIPAQGLDVSVEATFPEQEMAVDFGPVYWEGTVAVEGTARGNGFVELTGYAEGSGH